MPFRVNYGFQKAERDRLKREKKEAKQRERAAAKAGTPEDDAAPAADAVPGEDAADAAGGEKRPEGDR